ncbi:FAD-dependent oxidoreductase [Paenibacillus algorifonticola]|uniref:NAD(P)/FAD-dependent oxidoreductase n=1 Tax=Paenibacillus algorifonticola TaxID=684063 RepID=UPI003D2697F2
MKELHTGSLYWPTTLNSPADYPSITSNKKVKVAIVGGGMSGTICGYILAKGGIEAVMLERGSVAGGSTSANTGLLQFSNDIMLSELADQIGEYDAVRFYRGCLDAVRQLGEVAAQLPVDVGFIPRSSLYYATSEQDLPMLRKEYEMLRKHGFDVIFLEADDISRQFPFRKPGAIMTQGDAEVNPFQFVQGVSAAAVEAGLQIFEHTDIVKHERSAEGRQLLRTAGGWEIEAEHVIFAIGYEPEELHGQLVKADINRSFAAVTGVQGDAKLRANWPGQCLIWETARPYLYLRTTVDGRIVVGGLDEKTEAPIESEKLRRKRTDKLLEKITALFPMLDQPLEFEWSATFGESRDNLPFIGADPKIPGVYYCLGYGGNGTVYSMMAAYMLRDMINGEEHPLASIVRLDRPSLLKV